MSEVSRTVQITNRRGLHARASAKFVTLASSHPVEVSVTKDGSDHVTGTSIMGLMMLGAAMGQSILWRRSPNWSKRSSARIDVVAPLPQAGGVGGGRALTIIESFAEAGSPPPAPPAYGRGGQECPAR